VRPAVNLAALHGAAFIATSNPHQAMYCSPQ